MGFPPSSPWNMNWADIWSLTRENREGRLLCPLARLVALWGGGGERGGGGGGVGEAAGRGRGTGMASLPISCLSAQSFVSPLASHVPYCLCVSIYSQLLLSGSKIPLSWARPTLIARNILRLRLLFTFGTFLVLGTFALGLTGNKQMECIEQFSPSWVEKEGQRESLGATWSKEHGWSELCLKMFWKMKFKDTQDLFLALPQMYLLGFIPVCASGAYSLVLRL